MASTHQAVCCVCNRFVGGSSKFKIYSKSDFEDAAKRTVLACELGKSATGNSLEHLTDVQIFFCSDCFIEKIRELPAASSQGFDPSSFPTDLNTNFDEDAVWRPSENEDEALISPLTNTSDPIFTFGKTSSPKRRVTPDNAPGSASKSQNESDKSVTHSLNERLERLFDFNDTSLPDSELPEVFPEIENVPRVLPSASSSESSAPKSPGHGVLFHLLTKATVSQVEPQGAASRVLEVGEEASCLKCHFCKLIFKKEHLIKVSSMHNTEGTVICSRCAESTKVTHSNMALKVFGRDSLVKSSGFEARINALAQTSPIGPDTVLGYLFSKMVCRICEKELSLPTTMEDHFVNDHKRLKSYLRCPSGCEQRYSPRSVSSHVVKCGIKCERCDKIFPKYSPHFAESHAAEGGMKKQVFFCPIKGCLTLFDTDCNLFAHLLDKGHYWN